MDKSQEKQYANRKKNKKICIVCGVQPREVGRVNCLNCIANHNAYMRRKYAERKEMGMCTRCGKLPHRPNRVYCEVCAQKMNRIAIRKSNPDRHLVLERDNYTCQICGKKPKKLHVHHIDGNGTTSEAPNHDLDNRITLCPGCHAAITLLRNRNRELAVDLIMA
jgi:hypothetical protein